MKLKGYIYLQLIQPIDVWRKGADVIPPLPARRCLGNPNEDNLHIKGYKYRVGNILYIREQTVMTWAIGLR